MIAARAVRAAVPKKTPILQPASIAPCFRGYATQADTKPPIQLYGVDGTYASALVSQCNFMTSFGSDHRTVRKLPTPNVSQPSAMPTSFEKYQYDLTQLLSSPFPPLS